MYASKFMKYFETMTALEIYLTFETYLLNSESFINLWVKYSKQYSLAWSKTWTLSELAFFHPYYWME